MAKSIRQALLANEVANLAIFKAKGLIDSEGITEDSPKLDKVSTVKVDSKVKVKKHTDAELAKDSKSRHEFKDILSRQFGTEKGYTLGDAIEHSANVYKGIVKAKRNQLEKLYEIGKVLQELRSVIGKSDKEFGQAIKSTALKTMSRQDRSDAMWLSENWNEIQGKMRELDVSSCSASYLRQLLRKESKKVDSEATASKEVSEANDDADETSNEVTGSVEGSSLKLAENSAEGIASAVIHLAKANNISLAEIATLLLAESELVPA